VVIVWTKMGNKIMNLMGLTMKIFLIRGIRVDYESFK
jgi:hypothetical protein